jgi:photosystem II stability/assembly factor-like uncharacterized protein
VTFVPTTDDLTDLAVGSIAFAPGDPAVVYAAMGDPDTTYRYLGSGVLKSTNGGVTWSRAGDSLPSLSAGAKIAVDPVDANRVYLAQLYRIDGGTYTSDAGCFVSTDGGAHWTQTLRGSATDVVVHPTIPSTLFLGVAEFQPGYARGGIYRSVDYGATWKRVRKFPYASAATRDVKLAASPRNADRLYAFIGGTLKDGRLDIRLLVSSDRGESWSNQKAAGVDPAQFGYNTFVAADPNRVDTVYVGARDLYISSDAGLTWTNRTRNYDSHFDYNPDNASAHADQQAIAFLPGDTLFGSAFLLANDGGIYSAVQRAMTCKHRNSTLSLTMFVSLAANPTDPAQLFGGTQDNGSQMRDGDSAGWSEFSLGDGGACFVDAADPTLLYTTYVYGSVYRSRLADGAPRFDANIGNNATFGEAPSSPRIAFYPPFTGNGVDSTLYFGTWRLFVSVDRGATWRAPAGMKDLTKGGVDVLYAVSVGRTDPGVIYTGSANGRVMVSADGGQTWTDRTKGIPNRAVRCITTDPNDASTAFLTCSGFGTGHVFRTTDRGGTWVDVTGAIPDVPVRALLFDPLDPRTLYAGTDVGVFVSYDRGGRWEYFNSGMPPAVGTAFASRPDGAVFAATYGRGAYELIRVGVK